MMPPPFFSNRISIQQIWPLQFVSSLSSLADKLNPSNAVVGVFFFGGLESNIL